MNGNPAKVEVSSSGARAVDRGFLSDRSPYTRRRPSRREILPVYPAVSLDLTRIANRMSLRAFDRRVFAFLLNQALSGAWLMDCFKALRCRTPLMLFRDDEPMPKRATAAGLSNPSRRALLGAGLGMAPILMLGGCSSMSRDRPLRRPFARMRPTSCRPPRSACFQLCASRHHPRRRGHLRRAPVVVAL